MANEMLIKQQLKRQIDELLELKRLYTTLDMEAWLELLKRLDNAMREIYDENDTARVEYRHLFEDVRVARNVGSIDNTYKAVNAIIEKMNKAIKIIDEKAYSATYTTRKAFVYAGLGFLGYKILKYLRQEEKKRKGE